MNEKRIIWSTIRAVLESDKYKRKKNGKKSRSHWSLFQNLLNYFVIVLKFFGYFEKGMANAKNIRLNKVGFSFDDFPDAFDGYKIMHLSDFHLDTYPGIEKDMICLIDQIECDLCVMTGDYRKATHGAYRQVLPVMRKIVEHVQAKDGIVGIMGNHDTFLMVEHLEKMGIRMLINESLKISRGNDQITLTGTDDPYYYFTDLAVDILQQEDENFKIALVHTSELYDIAADMGYDLYLCGHTHGGQICLPGGRPVITHQFEGREFYKGPWKYKNMRGYTNVGCGVSAIPIRFNCPGEIALIELKKKVPL